MSLHNHGAIVPQDPLTGVAIGLPWLADECLDVNTTIPSEPTEHTLERGATVTDAIRVGPDSIQVLLVCSDGGSGTHPIPAFKGRAAQIAKGVEDMIQKRGPVRLWLRGYPPLKDYGFGTSQRSDPADERVIRWQIEFRKLEYAQLYEVPLAVDADLVAAGL